MITLTYLGAGVIAFVIANVFFWFGYWMACAMYTAGNTDDQLGIRG